MAKYITKRLLQATLVVLAVVTVMFFVFRLMPADPTTMLVEGGMTESARQQLLERWGLTGSVVDQYREYLFGILAFDFGSSFFYQDSTLAVLGRAILNTTLIAVPGMLLGGLVGGAMGALAGWRRDRIERALTLSATVLRGVPSFVLGIALLLVFSSLLGWFPGFGMGDLGPGSILTRYFTASFAAHWVLPVVAVALYALPENLLLMHAGVVENCEEDYIELLRAKGLTNRRIAWRAVRNSLLPVVTWFIPSLAETVAGIIVIEVVFSWPGIGRELVLAVGRFDYPIMQAAFFMIAASVVLGNLIADLLYPTLDPRVAYT